MRKLTQHPAHNKCSINGSHCQFHPQSHLTIVWSCKLRTFWKWVWILLAAKGSGWPLWECVTLCPLLCSLRKGRGKSITLFRYLVSTYLFSTSVSLFLPCKQVHLYQFSWFQLYVVICFSLTYFTLCDSGLSMSLQMTQFCLFYGWVIFHFSYIPHSLEDTEFFKLDC